MLHHTQKTSGFVKLLRSRVFLAVVLVILVTLILSVIGMYQKSRETAINKRRAEERLVDLKVRKERLESDIEQIKTPIGEEQAIREKFRVAKEGEGLVVIVDEAPAEPSEEASNGFVDFFKKLFRRNRE
jgi:lauroyl/myristoyl acyltransferase